jgi:hypothetical protein
MTPSLVTGMRDDPTDNRERDLAPRSAHPSRKRRVMGLYLLAGRGTGKSRMLGRKIAFGDFLAGTPQVIFDPVGTTIDNFLDKVLGFLAEHPQLAPDGVLERIVYCDLSGKDGVITPWPLYYKLDTERSLLEIAERYLQTIIKSNPDLFHAQVLGWPPLHRIGDYSGIVLAALGYQITEAEELLDNPEAWEAAGLFAKAEQVSPEAKRAVAYFRNKYIPMREADRARLTTPFLDKIFTFSLDDTFRAMFGATEPGIKWDEVVQKKQTVLPDFRHEQDEEMLRFKMLWAFDYLYSWIKTRGRQDDNPFGVIIDEFAHMTQKVVDAANPLAKDLDTFINVYMRQHTIWFTAAHQELYQIDEQLRNTLLSLGTYILGGTSSMESARTLADALFSRDPWWVKYWRPVYEPRPYWARSRPDDYEPPKEPEFMPLEEQTELFAQRIKNLGRFQFLLRPAVAEGHIGSAVLRLSIQDEDRDKATGEYQFPDSALIQRLRRALAKQSGIPIARLLKEQESRVPQALPTQPVRLIPTPPRQMRSQPNGHHAAQRARATPVASGISGSTLPQPRDVQPEQQQQKPPETLESNQLPRSGAKGRRRYRVS